MRMDINAMNDAFDSFREGTKEIAEIAHTKTKEFHENYISKVLPDCGKYGDAVKFAAEMLPGVSEYNAIRDGDWKSFAISAGIDAGGIALGSLSVGAGYAAVKGGSTGAKKSLKVAVKEISEAGTKKIAKETVEAGTEKAIKETVGAGTEKIAKEVVGDGTERVIRETAEEGAEKAIREVVKGGARTVEKFESQISINKMEGIRREKIVLSELIKDYGEKNVIREALIRDAKGQPIKDIITNEARRVDMVVKSGGKVVKSIEVTSMTAPKEFQIEKELRILSQAKETGGAFIKDPITGNLVEFPVELLTEIRRLQ